MGIVSVEELNRHMSSPRWHDDQQQAAQKLLDDVEGTLARALATYITPPDGDPFVERVIVSADTGLVMLAHPVHDVVTIDGTPGRAGYALHDARLYSLTLPPRPLELTVAYRPGWGAQPALHDAILERAALRFDNRHDDTITVRDDSTTRNNSGPADKPWPDEKTLTNLRLYRKIGIFR